MVYDPTDWGDTETPEFHINQYSPINIAELNKIELGIQQAHEMLASLQKEPIGLE